MIYPSEVMITPLPAPSVIYWLKILLVETVSVLISTIVPATFAATAA